MSHFYTDTIGGREWLYPSSEISEQLISIRNAVSVYVCKRLVCWPFCNGIEQVDVYNNKQCTTSLAAILDLYDSSPKHIKYIEGPRPHNPDYVTGRSKIVAGRTDEPSRPLNSF